MEVQINQQEMFDLHNRARKRNLEIDDSLLAYAQEWAYKMNHEGIRHHSTIKKLLGKWNSVAENIAWGSSDSWVIFDGWMKSAGHRENIMNENFQYVGIGLSGGCWCTVFAKE